MNVKLEEIVKQYNLIKKNDGVIVDSNGNELFHIYSDDFISCKIGREDIVLKPNGEYYKYVGGVPVWGKYRIDDSGTIRCSDNDNSFVYDCINRKIISEEHDGKFTFYNWDNYSETKISDGNSSKTRRLNHIEYDEDSYYKLMTSLVNLGNSISSSIASECSNISSICSSVSPEAIPCDTSGITSAAQNIQDNISNLNETVNYSLLVYDGCDKNLKAEVDKYLIDNLFDGEIKEIFKNNLNQYIEDRNSDGILEYKGDADFKSVETKITIPVIKISAELEESNLNYELFGLTKKDIIKDLLYVNDVRGNDEMGAILYAIINNCPSNFDSYHFQPGSQWQSNGHYGYNLSTIGNYQTNSEIININGVEFDFAQVFPNDCTPTEMLAYDFCKANVINTMRTFPDAYLEAASQKNRVVVLTCDASAIDGMDGWGGLYMGGNFTRSFDGNVYVYARESFVANNYYTRDIVIHEFGHKYDDILNGLGKFDVIFNSNMTDQSSEWANLYQEYKGILPDIVWGSYTEEGFENASSPRAEFFAECMVAYFLEPDELKILCPSVYDEVTKIFGKDYGGVYNNKINDVLNSPYDIQSKGNGYPTPQPGPTPSPRTTPRPSN